MFFCSISFSYIPTERVLLWVACLSTIQHKLSTFEQYVSSSHMLIINFLIWAFDKETLVSFEELETEEYVGLANNSTFFVSIMYLFFIAGLKLWILSDLSVLVLLPICDDLETFSVFEVTEV